MASQALYRKWRSQEFETVIGQGHVTLTLRHALPWGQDTPASAKHRIGRPNHQFTTADASSQGGNRLRHGASGREGFPRCAYDSALSTASPASFRSIRSSRCRNSVTASSRSKPGAQLWAMRSAHAAHPRADARSPVRHS